MASMKRLGRIMAGVLVVFACTAFIASIIGISGAFNFNPTKGIDTSVIQSIMSKGTDAAQADQTGFLKKIVDTFTVSDFALIFSRKNMLQIIVFSILFGVSTAAVGEKAKPVARFLEAGAEIMMKMVKIIMYYAPIGLGCYFASVVGQLGTQIMEGYLRVFILYLVISVIYYFGFFTLYAYIAGGRIGIKGFWKNVITPSITALATCSSAACIPVNLEYVKGMGVPSDIAETVIPLGANIHKDGSVIGGVMKITFLLGLFGKDMTSISAIIGIIMMSFLVGAVMAAIPGGGMIAEMLILSVYGFSPEVLPVIAVISVIIDAPATLLNSAGNTVSAMLVTRFTEGKMKIQDTLKVIKQTI
jgi:Na+/H+-dicarboxylate symporter